MMIVNRLKFNEWMGSGSRAIHQKVPTEATGIDGMKAYYMLLVKCKEISEISTSDTDILVGASVLHSFLSTSSTKLRSLEQNLEVLNKINFCKREHENNFRRQFDHLLTVSWH